MIFKGSLRGDCRATGAGRGSVRPQGGDGSYPAASRGRRTGFARAGECTPHSLFSLLREKRECAVHGVREKRTLLEVAQVFLYYWRHGMFSLHRRMDFFLFPRFAPSLTRLGRTAVLLAVDGPSLSTGTGYARSAGRDAWDLASKMQNNLDGTSKCGGVPPQSTGSAAPGRGLAI